MVVIVTCPDCGYRGEPIKDKCHIHRDCGEWAYICRKCESLNVDWIARNQN